MNDYKTGFICLATATLSPAADWVVRRVLVLLGSAITSALVYLVYLNRRS